MTTRKLQCITLLGIGLVGVLVAGSLPLMWHARAADEAAARKVESTAEEKDEHAADREAIQKGMLDFIAALERGDAAAVAAHWTKEGEYIGHDGTTLRGRDAIAKAYAEHFAKKPKLKVQVEPESLRFPSRDTAIGEGYFKGSGDGEPTETRYSVLHVREDGKWLMAIVREMPAEPVSLRDLDWLVGTWEAKGDGIEVRTTYEWWENKAFLRAQFTIKDKDKTLTGFQMIGKDAATGQLRSWTFEGEGGFGEATWSRDGKKWTQDAAGVTSEGSTLAATNLMVPVDRDTFTWQSFDRTLDGEELPDLHPIRVTRVKTK